MSRAALVAVLMAVPTPPAVSPGPAAAATTTIGVGPDAALCGWPVDLERQVLTRATRMMPEALRRILTRHRRSLFEGERRAREAAERDATGHLQTPLSQEGAARRLAESTSRAVDLLNHHAPLRNVAIELGVAAHFVADLSNPFQAVGADERDRVYAPRFGSYVQEKAPEVRVVFEGYSDPLLERGQVSAFGRRLADRSRSYLDVLIGAYRRFDEQADPALFDERSVPFGVASLSFSRSVTDTARAWLYAWREANGDLAGLPYALDLPRLELPPEREGRGGS